MPKTNKIRFTPVQVDAIRSAMYPGLTMVVGPPGTGKTDVAVQIVSNWYVQRHARRVWTSYPNALSLNVCQAVHVNRFHASIFAGTTTTRSNGRCL